MALVKRKNKKVPARRRSGIGAAPFDKGIDAVHYYFGDALGDYEASKAAGYFFIGVLGYSLVSNDLKEKCISNGCDYINTFKEIL